jgi:GTP 3',8-cyclase
MRATVTQLAEPSGLPPPLTLRGPATYHMTMGIDVKGVPRTSPAALPDRLGRPLRSLRVSVTDRCNLRCNYCMPQEEYVWLPRQQLLTFEEIAQLVGVFTSLGVEDVRLTGGEPLLRRDLPRLVRILAANPRIRDLALTTNGVLFAEQGEALRDAGLHRVTLSLDTLRPEKFKALAGRDTHAQVLEGIAAARNLGFPRLKFDTVVIRGVNDDELSDLIEYGRRVEAEVRFIEYMDVGGATDWSLDKVFTRAEILAVLSRRYGPIEPLNENSSAPAERFRLPDGTVFGIIASTTTPFCRNCDRSRLTADGLWYLCLYAQAGIDLRQMLRGGAPEGEIGERIVSVWRARTDRGAELRAATGQRGVLVGIEQLRLDPHLEMHTRGG